MTRWCLSSFSLWLGPLLCFYSAFLRQSSYFFSLMWAMAGHSSALLLLSVLHHCLQFELKLIWPGKSRHFASRYASEWFTPLRLPSALISCTKSGGFLQINHGHWVEPQTADQYLILPSDHNDNFSKYNKNFILYSNFMIMINNKWWM